MHLSCLSLDLLHHQYDHILLQDLRNNVNTTFSIGARSIHNSLAVPVGWITLSSIILSEKEISSMCDTDTGNKTQAGFN